MILDDNKWLDAIILLPMSEDSASPTFAIISSAPAANALLETICNELSAKTSIAIKPLVVRSYDKLLSGMRDGDVHIAWAPPLVAIDLERAEVAKIQLCSRRAGKADYSSALFVKGNSPIKELSDLKGMRAAWVAKESSAGYVVPRLKLIAEGLDPETMFSEQTMRRTHEAVVRVVMNGEADVGATFASFTNGKPNTADAVDVPSNPVSAGWLDAGYENDAVRILAVAGPIPSDVIAFATTMEAKQADAIRDAMQNLGETIRKLLNADAFDRPERTHFDELRRLVDAAHATPSPTPAAS